MAHLVYTDVSTRLELNLDGEEATGVVEFLLDLISHRSGQPKPQPVPEAAQPKVQKVPAPERPKPSRPAGLPAKTCDRDGCSTVFQPIRSSARFCSDSCRHLHYNGLRDRTSSSGGPVKCPECDATFKTAQALGGHMNSHTRARRAGNGKARENGKVTASAAAEPNRTLPVPEHAPDVAKAEAAPAPRVTPPVDRPYRCKEPGCGHPCRSQGELDSHRRAYHRPPPLPATTKVAAALTFPCPEDGCGRVYDDSNRLTHHLKVIHDYDRVDPVHIVEVHTPAQAVRIG